MKFASNKYAEQQTKFVKLLEGDMAKLKSNQTDIQLVQISRTLTTQKTGLLMRRARDDGENQ